MPYAKAHGGSIKSMRAASRKRAAAKVSAPLQNAIVRAVRRANPEEVKFATSWNSQQASAQQYGVWFNSVVGTNSYNLIPEIPQGVSVGQRTGDQIHPKRLTVDFWITTANLANNVDLVARLFVLQSRKMRDPALVNTVLMNELLDYGQTQGPFEGYTSQLSAPVNKEEFTVIMDRKFTIDKTYGYNPSLVNAYSSSAQGQSQGLIHHVRINIKCPKVLHYPDATRLLPDGFAPFFNAGYCIPSRINADGVDTAVTALSVQWSSTLYYTDS